MGYRMPEQHKPPRNFAHGAVLSAGKSVEQLFELPLQNIGCVPVCLKVAAVGIRYSLVRSARCVFVDYVNLSAPTQLLYLLQMAGGHDENEISFGNDRGRELSGAMSGEIDVALHANQKRLVGRGDVVPRIRSRARDVEILDAPARRDLACERFRHRASAGVATTDEKEIHSLRVPDQVGDALSQLCGRDRARPDYSRQSARTIDNGRWLGLPKPPTIEDAQSSPHARVTPL